MHSHTKAHVLVTPYAGGRTESARHHMAHHVLVELLVARLFHVFPQRIQADKAVVEASNERILVGFDQATLSCLQSNLQ